MSITMAKMKIVLIRTKISEVTAVLYKQPDNNNSDTTDNRAIVITTRITIIEIRINKTAIGMQ